MGVWASKTIQWIWSGFETEPIRILMLGLDNAGKTTVVYKLKLNEVVTTIPTIGFNVETVDVGKGVTFTLWDVGGQFQLRNLWRHYYQGAAGLIFLVDSSDKARFEEAREELHRVLVADELHGVPVVVMANKQDLPGAASAAELADALQLQSLRNRKWHIESTCAVNGVGIYESMYEMARLAKDFQKGNKW